jgi:ATP synthase protein I
LSGNQINSRRSVETSHLLKAGTVHLLAWLALAAALWLMDPVMSKSVLLGASVAVLPAMLMARMLFRFREPVRPDVFVRAVYRAELTRFLVTIVLFALVFAEGGPLIASALFGAFVVAMLVQWVLAALHMPGH